MCPKIYNLFSTLRKEVDFEHYSNKTPLIRCIANFVSEFSPIISEEEKASTNRLVFGNCFEPRYIYETLVNYPGSYFAGDCQEDAEEVLTFLLNGLDTEMISCLKVV